MFLIFSEEFSLYSENVGELKALQNQDHKPEVAARF